MQPPQTRRARAVALALLVVVAVVVYAADQATKQLVVSTMAEGERIPLLGAALELHFVRNPGAAFSLASGSTWIFSIVAAGVTVFIVAFARRIRAKAWGLVFGLLLAGTLGNLTDRLFREPSFGLGHVIDFISTPWMMPAIYNIADVAIVTSMCLLVLLTLLGRNVDGTRVPSKAERAREAAAAEAGGAEAAEPGGTESHDTAASGSGGAGAAGAGPGDDGQGPRAHGPRLAP